MQVVGVQFVVPCLDGFLLQRMEVCLARCMNLVLNGGTCVCVRQRVFFQHLVLSSGAQFDSRLPLPANFALSLHK